MCDTNSPSINEAKAAKAAVKAAKADKAANIATDLHHMLTTNNIIGLYHVVFRNGTVVTLHPERDYYMFQNYLPYNDYTTNRNRRVWERQRHLSPAIGMAYAQLICCGVEIGSGFPNLSNTKLWQIMWPESSLEIYNINNVSENAIDAMTVATSNRVKDFINPEAIAIITPMLKLIHV